MFAFQFKRLLPLILLSTLVAAGKYKFSIQEVVVESTREGLGGDDDLLLIISSLAGTSNNTNNWLMGSVEDGATVKQDNTTQEIDVPAQAANLSVAFGISNVPDEDETKLAGK